MKKLLSMILVVVMIFSLSVSVSAEDATVSADDTLRSYGMPEERIEALDDDIKQFMINDLVSLESSSEPIEYVGCEEVEMPAMYVNQVLSGIKFDCDSFLAGNTVSIYPTYEFTTDKRPRGEDSFSVCIGDALVPYGYGGQVWYKDSTMSNWAVGGSMVANNQFSNGAEYSGAQLGTPGWAMKIKGCAYVHAQVGSGTSKQCILTYMHNPNKASYSLSVNYGGFGIVYHSSGTIYSAAQTYILEY